ncbi:MAG: DUF2029 domain-containing protein [Deltaproteobacteria bacterium]|nr:DUF2029 domain-containing protein [Deltaproteobacteria bacterium]
MASVEATTGAAGGAPVRRLTFILCGVLAAHLAIQGLLLAAGTRWKHTVLHESVDGLVLGRGGVWIDSWGPMSFAEELARGSTTPLYAELFWRQRIKFIYPATSLPVITVARTVVSDDFVAMERALRRVSLVMVLMTALATAWILLHATPAGTGTGTGTGTGAGAGAGTGAGAGAGARGWAHSAAQVALVCALTGLFYPVVKAYTLGQLQSWINALFAVALACWLGGRRATAGALLGVICLWKPQYGLLLGWGALRRQWRFVSALAAVVVAGLLLSLTLYGPEDHRGYLGVLSHLGRHGEAYIPNQSLNGLLQRLWRNGDALRWWPDRYPPYRAAIFGLTSALALLGLGAALWLPRRSARAGGVADLGLFVVTLTVVSPIAWEHHHGVLLPLYAWLLARAGSERWLGRATWPVLGGSFAAAASYLWLARRVVWPLGPLLQSLLLGAALVVALLLALALRRAPVMAAGSAHRAAPALRVGDTPRSG